MFINVVGQRAAKVSWSDLEGQIGPTLDLAVFFVRNELSRCFTVVRLFVNLLKQSGHSLATTRADNGCMMPCAVSTGFRMWQATAATVVKRRVQLLAGHSSSPQGSSNSSVLVGWFRCHTVFLGPVLESIGIYVYMYICIYVYMYIQQYIISCSKL